MANNSKPEIEHEKLSPELNKFLDHCLEVDADNRISAALKVAFAQKMQTAHNVMSTDQCCQSRHQQILWQNFGEWSVDPWMG